MTEEELKKRKRTDVAEDGEVVRVPAFMMDHVVVDRIIRQTSSRTLLNRPGYVQLSDAEKATRERLYRKHDEKLTERWKSPTQPTDHSDTVQAAGDERLNAYQRYQQRVGNAWRHR
jgi:hypothetical protein